MKSYAIWLGLILCFGAFSAAAEEGAEDARKHMIRGVAAIEIAKSNSELALAESEFQIAAKLDPSLAAAWYNLGSVQSKLGKFNEAIDSYQHYLKLAPNAEDTQKVQDEIIKLEFKHELVGKAKARAGQWIASDGTVFDLKVENDRLTLITERHQLTDAEAISTYPVAGDIPISNPERLEFQLTLLGNQLSGVWMHPAMPVDKCTLPEERGNVSGELNDAEHKIVLRYTRSTFKLPTMMSLLSNDYCGGVEVIRKNDLETVFRGPIPDGWPLGLSIMGLQQKIDGVFIKYGWFGRLKAGELTANSPAYQSGLRKDDELMAIDGVEIKSLSAGEAYWRLFGDVGSSVSLTISRSGNREPLVIVLQRGKRQ